MAKNQMIPGDEAQPPDQAGSGCLSHPVQRPAERPAQRWFHDWSRNASVRPILPSCGWVAGHSYQTAECSGHAASPAHCQAAWHHHRQPAAAAQYQAASLPLAPTSAPLSTHSAPAHISYNAYKSAEITITRLWQAISILTIKASSISLPGMQQIQLMLHNRSFQPSTSCHPLVVPQHHSIVRCVQMLTVSEQYRLALWHVAQ